MALGIFCLMVSLEIPTAVELSTCMGVGGCGHFISISVVRMGTISLELGKRVPSSASASEDMMLRRILHTIWIIPLMIGV